MSIFHILTFVYITILVIVRLLPIPISSREPIIFNILRYILKITGMYPGASRKQNLYILTFDIFKPNSCYAEIC
jgi:hypothetical protein